MDLDTCKVRTERWGEEKGREEKEREREQREKRKSMRLSKEGGRGYNLCKERKREVEERQGKKGSTFGKEKIVRERKENKERGAKKRKER